MLNKVLRCIGVFFVLLTICGYSQSAKAQISCSVGTLNLGLGTINVYSSSTQWTSGNLPVTCSNTSALTYVGYACLSVGTGTGGTTATNRTLVSGSNRIPIQISAVAGGTQIGNGTSYPMEGPISANLGANATTTINFPVSVGVSPNSGVPAGSYSSTFSGSDLVVYGNVSATPPTSCSFLLSGLVLNGTLNVTANVANQCSVSSTNMNFGTASLLNTVLSSSAQITVSCNSSSIASIISLDNGAYGTGPTLRKMASGTNRITYGIYQDAAFTQPWGSTSGSNTKSITGTATVTAYGQVPTQSSQPPGSYSDVINVTVTY